MKNTSGLAGEIQLDKAGKGVEAFLTINIEQFAAPMAAAPMTSVGGYQQMPMESAVYTGELLQSITS